MRIKYFKASAHSFKRFTSRLLKLSFSLSMHLLPRMNVMLDFICQFQPYNEWILLKTVIKYLHWQSAKQYRCYITVTGLGKLATCRCMYITSTICQLTGISLITYEFCLKTIIKYLHWFICKTIQMLYHVTVATAIHMFTMLILCTCVSSHVY